MLLGKIIGKITTTDFTFLVSGNPKKFDYVQVYHKDYEYVLCQIVEMERRDDITTAKCIIVGYLDDLGKIQQIRTPFEPDTEVLPAEDRFIQNFVKLDSEKNGAYLGKLEGRDIPVHLNLNKLLTKHLAVLAKSGAGKSYTVGVLLEEIMRKKVPLLILDPHGEYSVMKEPNRDEEDKLKIWGLEHKGFAEQIQEYGDPELDHELRQLRLPDRMTSSEIVHLLPAKLSNAQQNVLFSAVKDMEECNLSDVLAALEAEDNNSKFSVINIIDYLIKLGIFSSNPTPYTELVQSGKCSIINLKGMDPDVQQIIASKLMTDLFELRKKEKIPPFFTVVEEAHNFCPERSFGETKVSKVMRTIASEGRKFGLGLCVISQRPARVDKSVLSQCSTQIILKVTNPGDVKAIASSVEGITSDSEKEIVNLPIGTALVTGVVDVPLFVNVRPRLSRHGGVAVNMVGEVDEETDFVGKAQDMMPIIRPKFSLKEIELIEERPIASSKTILSPALMLTCHKEQDFTVLYDLARGGVVIDDTLYRLPDLTKLSADELAVLKHIYQKESCTMGNLIQGGVSVTDATLQFLVDKDLLIDHGDIYSLNKKYLFTALHKKSSYKKIEYSSVNYDEKPEPIVSREAVVLEIGRFAQIKEIQECFLVEYRIAYKQ